MFSTANTSEKTDLRSLHADSPCFWLGAVLIAGDAINTGCLKLSDPDSSFYDGAVLDTRSSGCAKFWKGGKKCPPGASLGANHHLSRNLREASLPGDRMRAKYSYLSSNHAPACLTPYWTSISTLVRFAKDVASLYTPHRKKKYRKVEGEPLAKSAYT